jgi:hypothetical protein
MIDKTGYIQRQIKDRLSSRPKAGGLGILAPLTHLQLCRVNGNTITKEGGRTGQP